jgi:site-specific DNA recombinase
VDRNGTRVKVDRPAAEWIMREAPELRIVSETLWQATHARLRDTVAAYVAARPGWGRPPAPIQARYLLTGFTECALCGGSMLAWRRTAGHGPPAYQCAYHQYRRPASAPNARTITVDTATTAVVDGLRDRALAPDVLIPAIHEAVTQYQARRAEPGSRRDLEWDLERNLERVRGELDRLTAALASGATLPSVLEAIRQRENQRQELEAQLVAATALERAVGRWDRRSLERVLERRVEGWRGLLAGNLDEARQVLRQLLPGRLRFTPRKVAGYEITADLALGGILATVVDDGSLTVVPPG